MAEDGKSRLIGRAWAIDGEKRSLLAEQHRGADGSVVLVWHVPPEEYRGVIWLEDLETEGGPASAP